MTDAYRQGDGTWWVQDVNVIFKCRCGHMVTITEADKVERCGVCSERYYVVVGNVLPFETACANLQAAIDMRHDGNTAHASLTD